MTFEVTFENSAIPKGKDKEAPVYDDFGLGYKIYMRRQHLKKKRVSQGSKSAEEAAKYIGIDVDDYIGIERRKSGLTNKEGKRIREILNDPEKISRMAEFLEMDFDKLFKWVTFSQERIKRKLKNACSIEGTHAANKLITDAKENTREEFIAAYKNYFKKTDVDDKIILTLNNIDKYTHRITKLPSLPQPLFIVLNALLENLDKFDDIDKINVFSGQDENLSDYIEHCPHFASFLLYASNKLFDSDHPKTNFRDCFKTMTVERFSLLLYIMLNKIGIYEFAQDLRPLQKFHEFHTLGMRMAKLLRPHLPAGINYELLQQGLAMQGIGTYVLYVILSPSKKEEEVPSVGAGKEKRLCYNLSDETLDLINYYYHPVVSAELAANWGFGDDVVKLLLDHHNINFSGLSRECVILKMINKFVDCDFKLDTREDVECVLAEYENTTMNIEDVFKVVCAMETLKDEMIRASSSFIDVKSRQASSVTTEKIKTFTDKSTEVRHGGIIKIYHGAYEASDFRFEPEYLTALTNECYYLQNTLYEKVISKREGETFAKYGERMMLLQAALDVTMNNYEVVAKQWNIDEDELKKRLRKII
ncbi:MAG: hypothetical protein HQM16_16510 [Deltaproteobacteria bacterium]|nr:hypothetical protein [Deltaproteobacteria bacterium]